eukprot:NODE_12285_length_1234_cov_4.269196.p11 GENE.NODE_12285_length_1234_cov_4.269196~~NODE_12285_length_1234_cov_4.269196.p11  ORF type:complete len:79 (-),score=15.15 NODE_12285_length_1234_cov_4.269196:289-525(-)
MCQRAGPSGLRTHVRGASFEVEAEDAVMNVEPGFRVMLDVEDIAKGARFPTDRPFACVATLGCVVLMCINLPPVTTLD